MQHAFSNKTLKTEVISFTLVSSTVFRITSAKGAQQIFHNQLFEKPIHSI